MELEKLERRLETLTRKNKKHFDKERVAASGTKTHQNLDPESTINRKREIFRQICQIEYDLSAFEFYGKLLDFAMSVEPNQLKRILK